MDTQTPQHDALLAARRAWYVAEPAGPRVHLLLGPFFDRFHAEAALVQGAAALRGAWRSHSELCLTTVSVREGGLPTGRCNDEVLDLFRLRLQAQIGHHH